MASEETLLFVPLGANAARVFGMGARERACRLADNAGLECAGAVPAGRAALLAMMDYAWDPAWLKAMRNRPGTVLTVGGKPVMAHVPAGAHENGANVDFSGLKELPAETVELGYAELRKRGRPFILPLDPNDPEPVERAAYDAAYKGVSDALTLYLWRRPSFTLTRWAARAGLSPNFITLVGAALCLFAFYSFWRGEYWAGVASGFVFMVLDTVDGKLARVTGASSKWGTIFDHGIDLIHPPLWWWAWEHGLAAYGRPLAPVYATMVLWVIVGGYVAQRAIEGLSIQRFGIEIHVWQPLDSRFRLITAGRNPNMVILVAGLVAGRPDSGFVLLAWWTLISLIFHSVRFTQMTERQARGLPVTSWLEA